MALRLADRLKTARHRYFVGRMQECAVFQSALSAAELPFAVLYIFGPGGIGKTTLLRMFESLAQQAQTRVAYVDAREIEPTPDAFVQALSNALQLPPTTNLLQALSAQPARHVLLIDTFEALSALEDWLRETFLPELPDDVLVVLCGRQPPAPGWRVDPGWQALISTIPLRNLSPEESRAYLTQRELPGDQHLSILDFTHGHPLALSLVADVFAQRRELHFQPASAPDVIKTLLESFVQKTPGPAHRTALEACALVRLMTETLLSEMLGMPDVHELFSWLRSLSFIEAGPRGVFPHDLAREALTADLRWRNPDWYAELHRRARAYYARRIQQRQGPEQQRIMFDYLFLHRENPLVRPFVEWQESGGGVPDRMTEQDVPQLLALIERHEGAGAAQIATRWLDRQPQNVTVYRDSEQQPSGCLVMIELHAAQPDDLAADPATHNAWQYLQRHAPLRPGERAAMFRFWLARDSYQAVSAIQSLIFINIALYYVNTPGLAFTFLLCADPDFWEPPFSYMDLQRIDAAAFSLGGRRFGVFGHDWRTTPPLAWLDLLAERELNDAPLEHRPTQTAPLVVLSRPEFEAAVRAALRTITQPSALRANPLLRSRFIVDRRGAQASDAERIAELQAAIQRAAETLRTAPREAKWHRALYHTYLHPAATQEQAAELVDVPFSSYRRHLKAGVERMIELLWQWEVQGFEDERGAIASTS